MVKEFSAKKVDDAIKLGLAELGVTLDDVNVEVLDYGGFLRKAKVRLTVEKEEQAETPAAQSKADEKAATEKAETVKTEKVEKPRKAETTEKTEKTDKVEKAEKVEKVVKAEKPKKQTKPNKPEKTEKADIGEAAEKSEAKTEPPVKMRRLRAEDKNALERACAFITDVTKLMGFDNLTVTLSGDGETVNIDAPERDDSLIIGRHGETLSSLSYLAETCIRAEKCHTSVIVDCNGYRGRRAASLSAMARRKAEECVKRRRKIKLEPMDRTDRRTIHSALNEFSGVTTASEGKEPYRCVVILPAGKGGGKPRYAEERTEAPDEQENQQD